jgi:hypothetical protein
MPDPPEHLFDGDMECEGVDYNLEGGQRDGTYGRYRGDERGIQRFGGDT